MGLDPNDLRLSIEAMVSAPGAPEAAEQIREAGRAADETRARFDRLRDAASTPTTGDPVLPAFTVRPPAIQAEAPRTQIQAPVAAVPAPPPIPSRAGAQPPQQIVVEPTARQPTPQASPLPTPRATAPVAPPPVQQAVQPVVRSAAEAAPPTLQQTIQQVVRPAVVEQPPQLEQRIVQRTVVEAPRPEPSTAPIARPPSPEPVAQPPHQDNPYALRTSPSPGAEALSTEDVVGHLQTLETQYAANDARIDQIQGQLEGLRDTKVERPPWATGMTQTGIESIARTRDLNPHEPMWWEHLDEGDIYPEELAQARQVGTRRQSGGGGTAQSSLRGELEFLKAEQARILEASSGIIEAGGAADEGRPPTFYRTPEVTHGALPWNEQIPAEPVRPAVGAGVAAGDRARGGVNPADAQAGAAARVEPGRAAPAGPAAPELEPSRARPERFLEAEAPVSPQAPRQISEFLPRPLRRPFQNRFAAEERLAQASGAGPLTGANLYETLADTFRAGAQGDDAAVDARRQANEALARAGFQGIRQAGQTTPFVQARSAAQPAVTAPQPEAVAAPEELAQYFAGYRSESDWARLGEHYQIHNQFHQRIADNEPEFPAIPAAPPAQVAAAAPPAVPPPPRPPAPPAAAPAPEPNPEPIRAAAAAEQILTRAVSEDAIATARAAGANEDYLLSVRRIADANLARNQSLTETQALRQAAAVLGTSQVEAARQFPEPARSAAAAARPEQQRTTAPMTAAAFAPAAVDAERVRAALEGAGLNGRSLAESARITSEAYRTAQVDTLTRGLREAGVGASQARREAERIVPATNAQPVAARPSPTGSTRVPAQSSPIDALEQAGIQTRDPVAETRRSVEGLDEPLQRAQRGAGGLLSIFNLSAPSITRAGLALFGVGAGLNALVTLARRVHEELSAAVASQEELALRSREIAANFGPQRSPQLLAQATAFVANPQTRGSEQDYLAAANSLHGLASEYSLNNEQVNTLTTTAGQLARVHNTDLAPAVQAVQNVLRGNVDAAQQYGISLTDEYGRIRGLGATYEQLVGVYGRARAEQLLFQQVQQSAASQQSNSAGALDSSANALDRLQKASDQARQSLVHLASQPFNVAVNFLANLVGGFNGQTNAQAAQAAQLPQATYNPQAASPVVALPARAEEPAIQGGIADTLARAGILGPQWLASQSPATTPGAATRYVDPRTGADATPQDVAAFGQQLSASLPPLLSTVEANRQAALAASAVGDAFNRVSTQLQGDLLPALERLGGTQRAISGLGTIGQALRGPDELTGGDIPRRASVQAAQDVLSLQSQRDAQQYDPLVNQAQQLAPEEFARRQAAHTAELQSQLALQTAQRGQAAAQAPVTAINLGDQARQLDVAGDLAQLRGETLGREGAIVDLQRQEADLADRQRVAARENLDLLQQQTRARLDSLQSANQLNALQFGERRDRAEITAIRSDVRRGAVDPSALEAIPALRLRIRDERLAQGRAEFEALQAGRPAELAQQATTQDQLTRQLGTIPLQREQRGLEDQITPLQEAQRLTAERTQELDRQLEISRLSETSARTAAEQSVIQAQFALLSAEQGLRISQDWAANVNTVLTDTERAWAILHDIASPPDRAAAPAQPSLPPSPSSPGVNPTPDRQPEPPRPPAPPPAAPAPSAQAPLPPPAGQPGAVPINYQSLPVIASQVAPPLLTEDTGDQQAQAIRTGVRRGELDPSALEQVPELRHRAHDEARAARAQDVDTGLPPSTGLAAGQAVATPGIPVPGSAGGGEAGTYNITINVGANASPTEIARQVVSAMSSRSGRAPQATPRSMVGAR